MTKYMAHVGPSGSVFLKERGFFGEQGGFRDSWGKSWFPVEANGRRAATRLVCEMDKGARPYSEQAIASDRMAED